MSRWFAQIRSLRSRVLVPVSATFVVLVVGWTLAVRLDDLRDSGRFTAVLTGISATLAVAAIVVERRRPGLRPAPLIATLALVVPLSALRALSSPWWASIGALTWLASPLIIADLLLSYPDHAPRRTTWTRIVPLWGVPSLFAVAIVAVSGPSDDGASAVRAASWSLGFRDSTYWQANPLLLHASSAWVKWLTASWMLWVLAALAATIVVLVGRIRRADRADRQLVVALGLAGAVAAISVASQVFATWPERDAYAAGAAVNISLWYGALFTASAVVGMPLLTGLLLWLEILRPRLTRAASGTLQLPDERTPNDIEHTLRRALSDPTLTVAFRTADGDWVDSAGRSRATHARTPHADRAVTFVTHEHENIAMIEHDVSLLDRPDEVDNAAQLLAVAIDNERLRALTLAQAEMIRASGALLLDAADRARVALEARIVSGPIASVSQAEQALHGTDAAPTAASVETTAELILRALQEIRTISRGLAPPTLDEHGLAAALDELADLTDHAVQITCPADGRWPRAIETTLYAAAAHAIARGATVIDVFVDDHAITLRSVGGVVTIDPVIDARVDALEGYCEGVADEHVIRLPIVSAPLPEDLVMAPS